jgi:hypothetical protein
MKTCQTCGEGFRPTRRDALYCSGACKQWAYRRRRAAGTVAAAGATISVPIPAVVTIREARERPKVEVVASEPRAPYLA